MDEDGRMSTGVDVSSAWKGSLRFSDADTGIQMQQPNQNERIWEQMRVAYCGQLGASVVLGHGSGMDLMDGEDSRLLDEPREDELTLIFILLLQRLLEHSLR